MLGRLVSGGHILDNMDLHIGPWLSGTQHSDPQESASFVWEQRVLLCVSVVVSYSPAEGAISLFVLEQKQRGFFFVSVFFLTRCAFLAADCPSRVFLEEFSINYWSSSTLLKDEAGVQTANQLAVQVQDWVELCMNDSSDCRPSEAREPVPVCMRVCLRQKGEQNAIGHTQTQTHTHLHCELCTPQHYHKLLHSLRDSDSEILCSCVQNVMQEIECQTLHLRNAHWTINECHIPCWASVLCQNVDNNS